jgi:hypothetical protein
LKFQLIALIFADFRTYRAVFVAYRHVNRKHHVLSIQSGIPFTPGKIQARVLNVAFIMLDCIAANPPDSFQRAKVGNAVHPI